MQTFPTRRMTKYGTFFRFNLILNTTPYPILIWLENPPWAYLEYSEVEYDHDDTRNVEGPEWRPYDEVGVVEGTHKVVLLMVTVACTVFCCRPSQVAKFWRRVVFRQVDFGHFGYWVGSQHDGTTWNAGDSIIGCFFCLNSNWLFRVFEVALNVHCTMYIVQCTS